MDKRLNKFVIVFSFMIIALLSFIILFSPFHQEAPQNTIRILIDKPMDADHFRLQPLLKEKKYTYVPHQEDFDLLPADQNLPVLQFQLVRDENTRALIFLKGEADLMYDSLSFAKTEWIRKKLVPEKALIYTHPDEKISYLALNSKSPFLLNRELKSLITQALPVKLWTETVFFNWVESLQPKDSGEELAKLHLPPGITLRYLTTPSREGQQLAFLTREALAKIGVSVEVQIFEPSLFATKIRKRDFDLYSSTSLPGTKSLLDLPDTEIIPLFRWKHGLILNSRVKAPSTIEDSLDYSFRFLSELQLH